MQRVQQREGYANQLDKWSVNVLWSLMPIYLLMAAGIAAGVLKNSWLEWGQITGLSLVIVTVPYLAHRFGVMRGSIRYLCCVAVGA
ncbi:MAG TPA: hypothetical protein VD902_21495, partial [Symbiobacteriaceae bacterium]|nr:hypothetical protein [Symbiobacteriaceae bacterium]